MISALFRINNGTSGEIFVNGLATSTTHLKQLRQQISIIPQDPVIFSDNVRANLDPFGQFPDEAIWNALRQVELADYISSAEKKLDHFLEERGQNFSVGQKQLICLARALLQRNKILVIDEATANVDPRTDALIQKTIQTEFKECTVITIAHRLNTIIDSDRIGVISKGKMIEIDSPKNLLSNPVSTFYGIVQDSMDRTALIEQAGLNA